jgi:hypothetical protein
MPMRAAFRVLVTEGKVRTEEGNEDAEGRLPLHVQYKITTPDNMEFILGTLIPMDLLHTMDLLLDALRIEGRFPRLGRKKPWEYQPSTKKNGKEDLLLESHQ